MRVGGIVDISTKDIPNKSTMVIFTVGCNLSCEFCHNKYLLHEGVGRDIDVPKLMEQIKSNMLVSSVSISGGEPTLQDDLLYIAPYLTIDMPKKFKETCRVLKIPSKIRAYCFEEDIDIPSLRFI